MNRAVLAETSSVVAAQVTDVFVLRCFLCDWGYTLPNRWADVLEAAHEHEQQHGLAVRPRKTRGRHPVPPEEAQK